MNGLGRITKGSAGLFLLLIACSCAKFPSITQTDSTRINFRFVINREIRNDYIYVVALRTSTDINPDANGPVPVINFPAANGFVAGGATHYVRWDPFQSRAYILYRFTDAELTAWREVGVPITQTDVTPGSRVFEFELSTDQLSDVPNGGSALQTLQVNLLTMNRVSQSSGIGRVFDALGDTRLPGEINNFIRIPLGTSALYDNSRFALIEPPSTDASTTDCPDPDLDLVDWSIEVRRQ